MLASGLDVDTRYFDSTWVFNDLTSYEVKMEEWSGEHLVLARSNIRIPLTLFVALPTAINHSITYSIVAAEPATSFSSILSKIELKPVTTGPSEGSTYVSWSAQFSSDAGQSPLGHACFRSPCALAKWQRTDVDTWYISLTQTPASSKTRASRGKRRWLTWPKPSPRSKAPHAAHRCDKCFRLS